MDRDIVIDMVDDFDEHCIIFPGINGGPRKLAIDGDNGLCWAQPTGVLHHHLHKLPTKNSQPKVNFRFMKMVCGCTFHCDFFP